MLCQECHKNEGINYRPQVDMTLCNSCFDKNYYFDPFSKTKTGRKYVTICNELDKIEMYVHHVITNPSIYNEAIVLKNIISMIQFLRKSLYKPMYISKGKLPSMKALVNIDIADMIIKKRKNRIMFTCQHCGVEFKRLTYDGNKMPRFCSRKCYSLSLHSVINVSLLDKTAKVLENVRDEDLEYLETLRG